MSARILTRSGAFEGLDLTFDGEATIGRSDDNTVVLDIGSVSKRHARIVRLPDGGGYLLEDLGSLNGTKLDGLTVRAQQRLGRLSVVSFGGSGDLVFQDLERCARRGDAVVRAAPTRIPEADLQVDRTQVDVALPSLPAALAKPGGAAPSPDQTEEEAVPPSLPSFGQENAAELAVDRTMVDQVVLDLPPALGSSTLGSSTLGSSNLAAPAAEPASQLAISAPVLEVAAGDQPRRTYSLAAGLSVLGRADGCEIQILSEHLSRRHAVLRVDGRKVYVRDLGSKNGTIVGGVALEDEIELAPGDEILLGDIRAWWR